MLDAIPVTEIKGVGQETAKDLADLNIHSVEDLLLHFPYRYDDNQVRPLTDARHEEKITVEGKVHSEPSLRYFGKKKSRLSFRAFIDEWLIQVVAFNRPYLKKQLDVGDVVTLTGKWDQYKASITVSDIIKGRQKSDRPFEPVYSVKGKLSVKQMRMFMTRAFDKWVATSTDFIPESIRESYKLPERRQAMQWLHFPDDQHHLKHARRRMVYEELLLFQLKMQALKKVKRTGDMNRSITIPGDDVRHFIRDLSFELTGAQNRVVQEIMRDLSGHYHMNRLLQGDVGSGKTIVAAIALYAVIKAGYQGALMVPTEILAEQHAESFDELFADYDITVALLTSTVKGKRRATVLQQLQQGNIDLVIGTHALIQEDVDFHNLGLVITDEQHRFGVGQRRVLRDKGENPDVLYMTATPIPRTLAISAFGDMDVSTIDEMPEGRKKVKTYWARHEQIERVLSFVEDELKQGRQAYVVCPLIEESEQLDVQNAIDVHAMLQQHFHHRQIGLMHGRLTNEEKESVMDAFKDKHTDILVSTTVVEVGVNIPNATMMVIYDAQRFGLAQLHQLRGRVGRGSEQSYCLLIADAKSEVAQERMRIMTETTDGFELSEYDLKLRGPGDFFGQKQSGLPDFKIADIVHDHKALEVARKDAEQMIHSDSFWQDKAYQGLREYLNSIGVFDHQRLD
ncbi:ATP-dependent DNA helicase RecG [Tuberibacillus sp. Marseille-P3662]|uniref:ATP-dependent DNA helicase RecG n=1 Tax=Tuberibacillus sp. Marseille-P3662 TaxID=1965358 RepID=UPI000A1CEBCD|nr:ATP-dependent DNA helicase RecG [Tuberibacillus sp. Marseille-P3662]